MEPVELPYNAVEAHCECVEWPYLGYAFWSATKLFEPLPNRCHHCCSIRLLRRLRYRKCHYSLHLASTPVNAKQKQWYTTQPTISLPITAPSHSSLFIAVQTPPITAPTTLRPSKAVMTQLPLPPILAAALAYPPSSSIFLAPTAFSVLKQPNMPMPLALSFSYSSIFCAKQL